MISYQTGTTRKPAETAANLPEITAVKGRHMARPNGKPCKKHRKTEFPGSRRTMHSIKASKETDNVLSMKYYVESKPQGDYCTWLDIWFR